MKHSKNEVKRFFSNKAVIWILLLCSALVFSFRYCGERSVSSGAVCPLVDALVKNVKFPDGVNCLTVTLTDAFSAWIVTPPGSTYRLRNKDESRISEVNFWDGTSYFPDLEYVKWAGIKRGIFRLKGQGYAIVFVER